MPLGRVLVAPLALRITGQAYEDRLGQFEKASCRAILDRFTTQSSHTLPRADRQLRARERTRLRGSALRAKAEAPAE
jgi:hypothetical protein